MYRHSELAIGLCLLAALACLAVAGMAPVARGEGGERGWEASWRAKLDEGRDALEAARVQAEAAQETYQDWRQRKYPRGLRKQELVEKVEASAADLEKMTRLWASLLEQARRAGVSPGVLRDYE